MGKKEERKEIKEKLDRLASSERLSESEKISESLLEMDEVRDAEVIMTFYPLKDEPDIREFNRKLKIMGKRVVFPVMNSDSTITPVEGKVWKFTKKEFSVMEPDGMNPEVKPSDIDLVLVPLVGFDGELNRLGHGKGFYDRFLEGYNGITIGISYSVQKLEKITVSEYDRKLSKIITGKEIYC
ncbi:MAG: 5-formyltetrahydrofolate cyclo-ligase [Clostridia bacterium]|nr:5-formyltetrahydrofolate cyclo-ligase [Clostridia bacterium]